jgi:hypothetical protein
MNGKAQMYGEKRKRKKEKREREKERERALDKKETTTLTSWCT